MRRAEEDGDGWRHVVKAGSISACPRCQSTRVGASASKCPYCSKFFCSDCSPSRRCINAGDGRNHDTYEWVPIRP